MGLSLLLDAHSDLTAARDQFYKKYLYIFVVNGAAYVIPGLPDFSW
jgi:hypothetical protein